MSTNIPTGFKLTTSDFAVIAEWAESWRSLFMKAAEDKLTHLAAKRITTLIDRPAAYAAFGDHEAAQHMLDERHKYGPRHQVSEDIRKEAKEIIVSGYRDPQVDIEARMSLYPHNGEVYGIFQCDDGDFAKMFFELEGVEEYAYCNSTDDQLNYISEEEWADRGETWEAILSAKDKCFFMAGRGFDIKLTDGWIPHLDPEQIVAAIPSFEERCEDVAKDIFHTRRHREAFPDGGDSAPSVSAIVQVMSEAREARKEGAGKVEYEAIVAEVAEVLKPEITSDDLWTWPSVDITPAGPKNT